VRSADRVDLRHVAGIPHRALVEDRVEAVGDAPVDVLLLVGISTAIAQSIHDGRGAAIEFRK
jgi:hypothetical protein